MEQQATRGHVRTIKTGRIFYPVTPDSSNRFTGLRAVPWIQLRGIWLEQAGFSVGQSLRVEVQQKRVVLLVE